MKTSNKLLLGLFIVVVLAMVVANIRLKSVVGNLPELISQTTSNKAFSLSYKVNGNSKSVSTLTEKQKGNYNYGLFADSTKVLLSMDRNTSYDQLNQYKNDLKQLNIDLNIKKVEFDDNGKMKRLEIAVDCHDGFKGTVKQTLSRNNKIGFYRIYDKSATSPFGMEALSLE